MTPLPRFDVMSCRPSSSRGSGGIFWLLSLSLSLLISHYTFLDEREGGAAGDKSIPPSFPRVFELVLETDRRSVSLALCLPPRDATDGGMSSQRRHPSRFLFERKMSNDLSRRRRLFFFVSTFLGPSIPAPLSRSFARLNLRGSRRM